MRRYRHTKILATLGPVSSTLESIEKLFQAGVDNFRLNFSHGSHEDHQNRYQIIRALEEKYQRPIGILADLQGPKLRIHTFKDPFITLKENQFFTLDSNFEEGNENRVCLPHPEIFSALEEGTDLLLDDGKIRLKVMSCDHHSAKTQVKTGGVLSARKGVNVPHVSLPISALTKKDKDDLDFILKLGVDWIALSFVQHPKDIEELKSLVGDRIGIAAKIEKPKALDHLEEIVHLSDAVMVARGDLGVEMPPETVPGLQKKIIQCCRSLGKPVIVATQMLESMIQSPTPTRAETSDVATAVYDGVDSVMLSAESASGAHSLESVQIMNRIIEQVEQDSLYHSILDNGLNLKATEPKSFEKTIALARAARQISKDLTIKTMVTLTLSGSTALKAASVRPLCSIVAFTPESRIASRLSLVWGVHPIVTPKYENYIDMYCYINQSLQKNDFSLIGEQIIVLQGDFIDFSTEFSLKKVNKTTEIFKSKSTSTLKVLTVKEMSQRND